MAGEKRRYDCLSSCSLQPSRRHGLPDLNLLREWREPTSPGRLLRAGVGSVLVHVLVVIVLLALPEVPKSSQAPVITADLSRAVHLVAPRSFEPTQKAPNPSKARPELDVRSSLPARNHRPRDSALPRRPRDLSPKLPLPRRCRSLSLNRQR